jgi:hypothetical protein
MLFGAILSVVLENVVYKQSKIIQGTFLGPFCSKSGFWKGYLWAM